MDFNTPFAYSRTARREDKERLSVELLIDEYATISKKWIESPRYRFWDYALIFDIMQNEGYETILDVNLDKKFDTCFEVLATRRGYEYDHMHVKEMLRSGIRGYKRDVVSCIATLDHIGNDIKIFHKLIRHVSVGGILVITTDNEIIAKYKERVYTPEMLLDFSTLVEYKGYELYRQEDNVDSIDYLTKKNGLHSIVIQRTGQ